MIDLQTATHSDFEPCLNQPFRLGDEELRLVQVELRGHAAKRPAFSLIFEGGPDPPLAQAIHRLEHETLGVLELFLVPLGPARYEAVFA